MSKAVFDTDILQSIEQFLYTVLTPPSHPRAAGLDHLYEAIRYSALAGGKRMRPYLAVISADLFGVPRKQSVRAGAAIELIHCYSLIHDDLPAMDNSDLRRGRPTAHVRYDDATAILAGDGLLTEAFAVLAGEETHPDPTVRVRLISELAKAAGSAGMVGGQMMDILAETGVAEAGDIEQLQSLKTGALIRVSCRFGGYLAGAGADQISMLDSFADHLGLAFQITDDLLDIDGSEETTGKPVGLDEVNQKPTFVDLLGEAGAREKAGELIARAKQQLTVLPADTAPLAEIADFVLERRV